VEWQDLHNVTIVATICCLSLRTAIRQGFIGMLAQHLVTPERWEVHVVVANMYSIHAFQRSAIKRSATSATQLLFSIQIVENRC